MIWMSSLRLVTCCVPLQLVYTGFIKHILWRPSIRPLIIYSSQLFNQHCILQSTILTLKWPMCADVPLNQIKTKKNQTHDLACYRLPHVLIYPIMYQLVLE